MDGGIDQVHIEKPLLINGNCGICDYDGNLTAFNGSYSGVSVYYDRFPYYMVRSPLYSGKKTIGRDVVVIRNNSTESSLLPMVKRYAVLLAHAEITLATLMINARVSSVPTAINNKQKALVDEWRKGVFNGKINTLMDSGFLSLRWVDINNNSPVNIKDLVEVRENILCSFYHDVGVRTTIQKKGNLIDAELKGNDAMLLININDMLEERKRGCDRVNKMFGTSWSVDKCEELKYNDAVDINEGGAEDGKMDD